MPLVGEQGCGREETEGLRGTQGAQAEGSGPAGGGFLQTVLEGDTVRGSLKRNCGIEDKSARIRDPSERRRVAGNIHVPLYLLPATQECGLRRRTARGPHRHPMDGRSDLRTASRTSGVPAPHCPPSRKPGCQSLRPCPPTPRSAMSTHTSESAGLAQHRAPLRAGCPLACPQNYLRWLLVTPCRVTDFHKCSNLKQQIYDLGF